MEYYFTRYGDLDLHRRMVGDRRRTDAFAEALYEVVTAADTVLDVGTGTGILAMLAAKAGAKKVVAIDQAEIAQTAANLVKANGLGERVKVLRGAATELRLEEKADILVSEWLGNLAFVEAMFDDVLVARDHNLRPGGRMIPSHVDVRFAPVDDPILYAQHGPGFWTAPVHGLDLSSLEAAELEQGRAQQLRVDQAALLSDGQVLVGLDLATASADDAFVERELSFSIRRDGVLNGFVGWFVAELSPSVQLDTGPAFDETHWAQTYVSFPPRMVRRGSVLRVQVRLERDPGERRQLLLSLGIGQAQQKYVIE